MKVLFNSPKLAIFAYTTKDHREPFFPTAGMIVRDWKQYRVILITAFWNYIKCIKGKYITRAGQISHQVQVVVMVNRNFEAFLKSLKQKLPTI